MTTTLICGFEDLESSPENRYKVVGTKIEKNRMT
jgi:hypothetical protein